MSFTRFLRLGALGILSLLAGWFLTSFLIVNNKNNLINNDQKAQSYSGHAQNEVSNHETENINSAPETLRTNKHFSNSSEKNDLVIPASTKDNMPATVANDNNEATQNNAIPVVPYTSTLAGMFATEPADEKWASESEPRLRNQITVDAPLIGAEIKSVECKSTTCKITAKINSENDRQLEKLSRDLSFSILNKQRDYFDSNIMSVYSKENKTLDIYVGRINIQQPQNILQQKPSQP